MKLEYCPTCYLNYLGKIFTVAVIAALFTITAFDASAQARGKLRQATDIAPTTKKSTVQASEIRSAKSSSSQAQGKQYTPTVILAPEKSAVTISQCANGKASAPEACNDTDSWVSGNVNESKAHYREGDSIVYRAVFTGLTPGVTYTYGVEYDTSKAGKHAIDYLTTYNRIENGNPPSVGPADPCFDVVCGSPSTRAIPLDPRVTAGPTSPFAGDDIMPGPDGNAGTADDEVLVDGILNSGVFTLWNGTITGVGTHTLSDGSYTNGAYVGDTSTSITVTFTASSSTVVLAWGGHISHRKDWGSDASAVNITGSPYHMRNFSWSDGNIGNTDLQLSASAVELTASIRIIKALAGGLEAAGHDFTFTYSLVGGTGGGFVNSATPGSGVFAPGTFTLDVDGGADPTWSNEVTSNAVSGLSASSGISSTGTITELEGPGNFTLQSIVCNESGPAGYTNSASIANVGTRTVSVNLQEGELLTCTFTNNVVLAADATITGRVLTSGGYGIRNAYVTITDVNTGEVRTVLTNQFGYYTFANLEVGHFFSLRVSARRYTFSNPTQSFSLGDSLANVNFVAN